MTITTTPAAAATAIIPPESSPAAAIAVMGSIRRHSTVRHVTETTKTTTCSPTSVLNSVVAGYAAGVSGTLAGHPFDSLKVWIQTKDHSKPPTTPTPTTTSTVSSHTGTTNKQTSSTSTGLNNTNTTSATKATTTTSTTTITNSGSGTPTRPPPAATSSAAGGGGVTSNVASSATAGSTNSFLRNASYQSNKWFHSALSGVRTISATAVSVEAATFTTSAFARERIQAWVRRTRALYAGVGAPLVTVGLVQSVNFAVYDSCRRVLYRVDHPTTDGGGAGAANDMEYLHNDSILNICIASFAAGSTLAVFTSPMLIVKTKQQTQGISFRQALKDTFFQKARSSNTCILSAASLSPKSMFVGFPVHFLSETVGRCVYYATYESLKRYLVKQQQQQHQQQNVNNGGLILGNQITLQQRMACAAASGVICWSIIFPLDAVRSRMFAQRIITYASATSGDAAAIANGSSANCSNSGSSKSITEMIQYMYTKQGGIRAFFRGYGVTILRAGPVAAAVLPIYDMTLEYLSSSSP